MNTLSSDECCVCGSNQLVTIPDSGEVVCERKNLTQAFVELDTLKDKLGLPSAVIEKTAHIYRKIRRIG